MKGSDFRPTRLPAYTRGVLLIEIQRVVSTYFPNRCPSHKEFNLYSRVHSATVVKEFGSWANALRSAGFQYSRSRAAHTEIANGAKRITPDQLLTELKTIANRHRGGVFQYEDYRKLGGKRARGTFCKYLGGWRTAVASIGLKDGFSRTRPELRTYADEDYFAELQRIWEMFGRQPTVKEMRENGRISPQSFQQRFGSWMRSVYAFCKDRNGPEDPYNLLESSVRAARRQTQPIQQSESQVPVENPRAGLLNPKRRTPRKPSVRLRFQVLKRDNFTCRACGRSPATEIGVLLEVDHIFAWSRGGETILANLQTLCDRCNSGKSDL